MRTKVLKEVAIVGKNVEFTSLELQQMARVCNKIEDVIANHHQNTEKKIYLSDDDLFKLESIFMCILETENNVGTTCFDQYEKNSRAMWESVI